MKGDWYTSFLQPMRSISHTPRGILMPIIVGACAILGGAVLLLWKTKAMKRQQEKGTYVEMSGDVGGEMIRLAKRWAAKPQGSADHTEKTRKRRWKRR